MSNNNKVKNAKNTSLGDVKFRSKLEKNCYIELQKAGLDFKYEAIKFVLWEGFRPENITLINNFYSTGKRTKKKFNKYEKVLCKDLYKDNSKIGNITYTPDFIVKRDKVYIIIETKGNPNDVFPYKKKMFLKYLEEIDTDYKFVYMELRNNGQIKDAIELIKKGEFDA